MAWFRRERTLNTVTGSGGDESQRLTAEQRGNVTDAHRSLLGRFTPRSDAEWSTRAVWACLEELRHSTTTEAAEVQVFDAWTDGPAAFCVVYSSPYQPNEHVGLRRERCNLEVPVSYGLSSGLFQLHGGEQVDDSAPADPIAFGVAVAAFDVGEPLGNYYDTLRRDVAGIGWWGDVDGSAPLPAR